NISNARLGSGVPIETTSSASFYVEDLKREHSPAISSPLALPLKKNNRKKKTDKTSMVSTETESEVFLHNTTNNTDNISKMGFELEE
ncbi:2262_t:CDS:1, partial [Racocetra fulgida]